VAVIAVQGVAGYYIFQRFSAGFTKYPAWKYVHRNINPAWFQNDPATDLASRDLRCNVGGEVTVPRL